MQPDKKRGKPKKKFNFFLKQPLFIAFLGRKHGHATGGHKKGVVKTTP
jgi:hypothetical protein